MSTMMNSHTMDRFDRETLSSATIKTDTGSCVLPGDKRGLPYEIWAIILSNLPAEDLCRSAMVCKTWNDLVISLDHTKWRDLYLRSTDWRHPNWPLNLMSEPPSWRLAFREQYIASYFWTQNIREQSPVTCMSVFKRTKMRKTITVGVGKEHATLKSALAVANDYDRIMVYPGIYDEQFEMSSKIPFELIGCGELGSVILVVCIEQTAMTGRVGNLVFRAPWFTNFILKVRSGYLQVDNCILEDGMVYVQHPGSVSLSFCTFRHATIILQHVNASVIQNCEFSQTDAAAITVEGYPKEERNWTYRTMLGKIMSTCTLQKQTERQKSGQTVPKSAFSTAISLSTAITNQKLALKSHDQLKSTDHSECKHDDALKVPIGRKQSCDFDFESHELDTRSCDISLYSKSDMAHGACGGVDHQVASRWNARHASIHSLDSNLYHRLIRERRETADDHLGTRETADDHLGTSRETADDHLGTSLPASQTHSDKCDLPLTTSSLLQGADANKKDDTVESLKPDTEKYSRIESFMSDCAKYSSRDYSGDHGHGGLDDRFKHSATTSERRHSKTTQESISQLPQEPKPGPSKIHRDSAAIKDLSFESDVEASEDVKVPELNLHLLCTGNAETESDTRSRERAADESSLSSSEVCLHSASGSDISEDDREVNSNPDSLDDSSSEDELLHSDAESSFSSSEESVIMLTYPERHQPRSLSAQKEYADVASINSQNQSEHIDIVQDSDMRRMLNEVRGCFIHKCRITQSKGGVMVSLQAHAIILECEINSVGYGIRCIQNSRTVILKNEIHHCRTSGVFMRLAASGLVTGNDIHSNNEAGVDIRKNADPIVQCNRIHHGKRSGVVVLGSGRGQIKHNDIYQNKEAGVYILYRGNPTVSHNQIYSGRAAGIAVNEGGRGYIHDNIITGNQWGGIDIRHTGDPVIYHNTVCNGISDGIVVGEGGRGSIENNIITGNAGCGVWIMAAHQPLLHGNEIHSNRDSGISLVNRMDTSHRNEAMAMETKDNQSAHSLDFWGVVSDDQAPPKQRLVTMATVEYNKVYHNEGKGISVQFGEGVVIQCNVVHGNKGDGISVNQPYPAVVKDNSVTNNNGSGVIVCGREKMELRGNGIYDNRDYGISCQTEADICENDVLGNNWSGVHVQNCDKVKVTLNRIQTPSEHAVCLADVKSCAVENNKFYVQGDKAIFSDNDSNCTSIGNQVLPKPDCKFTREENTDLGDLSDMCTTRWILDPAPRPYIDTPRQVVYAPTHHVTTITRVTVPSDNCERGSRFCVIV